MKIKIPKFVVTHFVACKRFHNSYCDRERENPIIGNLWWMAPDEILWLYATKNEEEYEGSQTQVGIKKDGTVVWSYYSHCSCYGYEEACTKPTSIKEFLSEMGTEKICELVNVPDDILKVISTNLKEITKNKLCDVVNLRTLVKKENK